MANKINYNFDNSGETEQIVYPADVVLVEGILVFYFPEIRDLFHMKLFVDTDSDTRLSRRGTKNSYRLKFNINYTLYMISIARRQRKK